MCLRLCCDPYKLTYIAAIYTAVEAVLFGTINFLLILVATCIIKPTDRQLHAGLDQFYSWYYYSVNGSCTDRYGQNFTVPDWVKDDYPLPIRPKETLPDTNLAYQISYLVLHAFWFISAFILMYGNARKRWGYYLPWLLISITFTFMDIAIGAFFIIDMLDVLKEDSSEDALKEIGPMIWSFSLYLRGYVFWFGNLGHLATVLNAFCKTYHKRSKEKRKRKKLQRKQERELAKARMAAAAEAQASYNEVPMQTMPTPNDYQSSSVPSLQHDEAEESPGAQNYGYEEPYNADPPDYVKSTPLPPKVPKEVRPFSYLNPGFRPNNPHDVTGMKANPSPNLPEVSSNPKGQSYFSAVPPADYDDENDDQYSPAQLPRLKLGAKFSSDSSNTSRNPQPPPNREQNTEHYF
ncbi:uncharacterized protein LOC135221738 [Macrobrachium nipponense]|uniref:uncharacterized protein LOC135221738 n=1 Tax=Macrobrachium nipponense TaxID=159736 RepID=UPI0030C886D6